MANWESTGGNPGGFLRLVDPATGPNTDAFAPAKFLGDWSAYDGVGSISADFQMISSSSSTIDSGVQFFISGPGGAAFRRYSTSEGLFVGVWRTYPLPIMESEWTISSGTWSALLSDITT